ncbi:MAG: hypothetical protein HOW73_25730 [Polyangiaceae bacterium]|nr:hypothetical protein [Polyangiaceae bacterium]
MAEAAHTPKMPTTGRLAILTGLSLAASAIPVPLVPDRIVFQIRGAIVQDVASRHGLSLTTDGRRALAEASSESPIRESLKKGLGFLSKTFIKKLSPLATFFTASSAVEVFAMGHLFDRYLELHRGSKSVRIHGEEARAVRKLIDAAMLKALSPTLRPDPVPLLPPPEDLRDEFTRWIDTVILLGAGLPGYLERRLDSAFDAVVAETGAPAA